MASFLWGFCARYFKVTSGSPSRIIRCTMIRLLNTMVQVESRNRFVRARKISATPASPAWVATRMCSTYLDFGAASYGNALACRNGQSRAESPPARRELHSTLIFVPPFTLFSKELAMGPGGAAAGGAGGAQLRSQFAGSQRWSSLRRWLRWVYRNMPARRRRIRGSCLSMAEGDGVGQRQQ